MHEIETLNTVTSTNDYLKSIIPKNGAIHICLAEEQTAGRGRPGKIWHSPRAKNIYLSLLWPNANKIDGLSLVIGIAIVEALKQAGIHDAKIKWPNDILHKQKKLAGILIESGSTKSSLIIGIGLNVNMDDAAIDQDWTSCKKIFGKEQDRSKITELLISSVLANLHKFSEHGFAIFLSAWQKLDALYGKKIRIENDEGVAHGVDANGRLLLQHADGSVTKHASGSVCFL